MKPNRLRVLGFEIDLLESRFRENSLLFREKPGRRGIHTRSHTWLFLKNDSKRFRRKSCFTGVESRNRFARVSFLRKLIFAPTPCSRYRVPILQCMRLPGFPTISTKTTRPYVFLGLEIDSLATRSFLVKLVYAPRQPGTHYYYYYYHYTIKFI